MYMRLKLSGSCAAARRPCTCIMLHTQNEARVVVIFLESILFSQKQFFSFLQSSKVFFIQSLFQLANSLCKLETETLKRKCDFWQKFGELFACRESQFVLSRLLFDQIVFQKYSKSILFCSKNSANRLNVTLVKCNTDAIC